MESQIDALLRQAEQRLQKSTDSGSALVRAERPSQPPPSAHDQAPPKQKDALSVREPQLAQKQLAKKKKDTAGSDWFDLPKTDATTEIKRDWQLLRMRNLLDPKQQKKQLRASLPKYSQVGEVIAAPTDPKAARFTRKQRKRTLLEDVMSNHDSSKLKHKYAGIQKDKTSGKKASYQKLMAQRKKRRN